MAARDDRLPQVRASRVRAVGIAAAVGAVGSSLLLAALYDKGDPSRSYYGTDTRASELLVGALLATLLWGRVAPASVRARRALQGVGAGGAIAFVAAVVLATGQAAWLYYGGFLAVALAVAAVIAALVQPDRTSLRAVLAWRPVCWIGLISFGLYLWHWPVRVALSEQRTGISGWRLTLVWIGVSLVAAVASFYLVEEPIRRGRRLRGSRARRRSGFARGDGARGDRRHRGSHGRARVPDRPPGQGAPHPGAGRTRSHNGGGDAERHRTADPLAPGRRLDRGQFGEALQAEASTRGLTFTAATRPGCGLVTGIPAIADGTAVPWGPTCDDETTRYLTTALATRNPRSCCGSAPGRRLTGSSRVCSTSSVRRTPTPCCSGRWTRVARCSPRPAPAS